MGPPFSPAWLCLPVRAHCQAEDALQYTRPRKRGLQIPTLACYRTVALNAPIQARPVEVRFLAIRTRWWPDPTMSLRADMRGRPSRHRTLHHGAALESPFHNGGKRAIASGSSFV
jgi:hypothetical protein